MLGHGCPHFVHRICALLVAVVAISLAPISAPIYPCRCLGAQETGSSHSAQLQPDANLSQTSSATSTAVSTKLRFSWGGGEPKTWRGKIAIGDGTISNATPLGVTLDATASVKLDKRVGRVILVNHWSPTGYGGADVELTASLDTKIFLELTSVEEPDSIVERTITLKQLVDQMIAAELDTQGNRFSASRAPGDSLRVQVDKPHLVFEPGESLRFSIQPMLTGLATRTANCRVKVVLAGTSGVGSRALYSKSVPFSLDETGSAAEPIDLEIPVPNQEEIYDVELELEPIWYRASFGPKSNSIKRNIQFIVLDQRLEVIDNNRRWRQVSISDSVDFNPSGTSPPWNQIPKLGRNGRVSLGNELRSTTMVGEEKLMTLRAGGWQAIPLDVGRLGEPHVIELEYVSNKSIAMGLSLLQPDASGQIPLYGFDSGVFVPDSLVARESHTSAATAKIQHHRITVWPSTKTPYLLVANRHSSDSVTIGKVRVFAGPAELPAKKFQFAQRNSRKLMAFYESPLFAENFGALAQSDADIVEPLDDWRMFYTGASRLIQYLKSNSYRGAFITVACDGSSIFPSKHLAATPKHDNGVFFNSGQDPIRKDVLEMLFRMFEREGLTLVPSLALSAPLPEIEALRISVSDTNSMVSDSPDVINGFDLVDLNSVKRQGMIGEGLPVYNPLDPHVQQAVTRVVKEIADRYRQYNSFGGVSVVCRPDTYSLLPGRQWGYDRSTVTRFVESQSDLPAQPLEVTNGFLTGAYRKQWIQWRADQMTAWYQDMLATVRRSVPNGKLYLAPVDLYHNEETASALSPSLHTSNDFTQVMLHAGFDLERLQHVGADQAKPAEGIVFLNPHRIAPEASFSSQRVDYSIQQSSQAKPFYERANYRGDLFTHRVAWAHFMQLQRQSPFGEQTLNLMRLQPMAPAQQFNRRRFVEAIKQRDARLLVDGGPIMTFGQESAFADLMSVFNQLPDEPFADVVPASVRLVNDSQRNSNSLLEQLPITVRQLRSDAISFFYVANASPWPIQLRVVVKSDGTESPTIESFSKQSLVATKSTGQSSIASLSEILFEIPAYSIAGGRSENKGFSVEDYGFTLPEGTDKVLKKQVYALEAKLMKSNSPAPLSWIENPDFEMEGRPSLHGWDTGQQETGKIRLISMPDSVAPNQEGASSLFMSNQGDSPVWIRSNTFVGPDTGRLSISVWLRINENGVQPPLRLAVEGRSKGVNYYRFGSVGSLSPDPSANQVNSKWKRFAVHFDDLPIERVSSFRVGFDLMGPGEVLVDGIQIYDRWFDENDAKAITQMLASTGPLLSKPETIDSCRRLLESYWIQFLDRYVETGPSNVASSAGIGTGQATEAPQEVSPGDQPYEHERGEAWAPEEKPRIPMFRRFRNMVPARKPQLR